ncbi:MAG: Ig-like domain-containing protein [Eisenbergiella sp.]
MTGVRVSQSSISGKVGDKVKLDAYVDPDNANNKKVSWETKNDSVATVNDGNVTFVGEGTTDIIVKTDEGGVYGYGFRISTSKRCFRRKCIYQR